jgi:AraC-like DNA-binding protein
MATVVPSGLLGDRAVYRSLSDGRSRVGAGFWSSRRPHDQGLFAMDSYALVWVLRGNGTYRDAQGHRTRLGPGDVFQRLPDVPHQVVVDAGWQECWLDAGGMVADAITALGANRHPTVSHPGIDLPLLKRIDRLVVTLHNAKEAELPRWWPLIPAIVAEILALAEPTHRNDPHANAVEAACRMLAEGGNMAAFALLAQRHGLSSERLRKCFVARVGCAPMTWARRARLDRARELLLTTDAPISEIAQRLGWSSAAAFTKRFTCDTGRPPSAYRRRDQN